MLFAFNQGEVCTCPSRALIQESIYDKFMERVLQRVKAIKQGNPLDTDTQMGAQASKEQLTKILSYLDLGKQEGAEVLIGGEQAQLAGELQGGYYVQPTLFKGHNFMDWALASGAATATLPTAWGAPSRRVACGPIATTLTRPMPRLAGTRSPALAAKITR